MDIFTKFFYLGSPTGFILTDQLWRLLHASILLDHSSSLYLSYGIRSCFWRYTNRIKAIYTKSSTCNCSCDLCKILSLYILLLSCWCVFRSMIWYCRISSRNTNYSSRQVECSHGVISVVYQLGWIPSDYPDRKKMYRDIHILLERASRMSNM